MMSDPCKRDQAVTAERLFPLDATISRSHVDPAMFAVTINRHPRPSSRVERMDRDGLALHLREWNLCERTITTILNLPVGMAITLKLGEIEARRGERPKPPLVA